MEVRFTAGDNIGPLRPEVAVCLFRIAQESLRNGIEHGGATHLTVTLARASDAVELTVTDDGRGFDVDAVRAQRRRAGPGDHGRAGQPHRRHRVRHQRSRRRHHGPGARCGPGDGARTRSYTRLTLRSSTACRMASSRLDASASAITRIHVERASNPQ